MISGIRDARFDGGFADGFVLDHDGEAVANGIDEAAFGAAQAFAIRGEDDRGFADGADEQVEQFLADGQTLLRWATFLCGRNSNPKRGIRIYFVLAGCIPPGRSDVCESKRVVK